MFKKAGMLVVLALLISSFFMSDVIAKIDSPYSKSESSAWLTQALKLQREIDINVPLNEAAFIGTHNSYNSKSYATPIRYIDPNQRLSITEQLEAGIRSIELDVHWTMSANFSKDILLCHAKETHVGCSVFDRNVVDGLQEIRDWLKSHPNEIILLYFDRYLDGHEPRLTSLLEKYLGEFIYKASYARKKGDNARSCVAIPSSTLTKNDILKAKKQLIIVAKKCDGTNPPYEERNKFNLVWNDYVFAGIGNIPVYPFTFIDSSITNFKPHPDCSKTNLFAKDLYHSSLWRIYEDRTKLSDIFQNEINLEDHHMRQLTQCGINWPSVDMLMKDDSRLFAAIWSWSYGYPKSGNGNCALNEKSLGIKNADCNKVVAGYACKEIKTHHVKSIALNGGWANGESACQTMLGKNWHFSTPVNGSQMHELNESMASLGLKESWLNYNATQESTWIAN